MGGAGHAASADWLRQDGRLRMLQAGMLRNGKLQDGMLRNGKLQDGRLRMLQNS